MKFIFAILATSFMAISFAQAKIEVSTITGSVSGRTYVNGEWTIYASQNRLGEECSAESEYVTCDACVGAKIDDSCSTRYVRKDSYVIFVFTSEEGKIRVTNSNDIDLSFRVLGKESSSIKRVAVKWDDILGQLATKTSGQIKLIVGNDVLPIGVRYGNIPKFDQKDCDSSNPHGICDFTIDQVGDVRMISISTNGMSSRDERAFDYSGFRIFAMPVQSAKECVEGSKACTETNGPGSMSFDVRVTPKLEYDDKFMMDFSKGQKYCIRVANIDVARNLSSATATCNLVE